MTLVLDTNVIVAALVTNGLCHEVLRDGIATDVIVSSVRLLDELEQTLTRKFSLTQEARGFLLSLRTSMRLVEPAFLEPGICRDPDDEVVLATAVAGKADLIVTGDDDLLVLRSFRNIEIVTPRAFLAMRSQRR